MSPQRLILRNTVLLVGAQVVAAPLSFVINAVAARTLGAADFGQLYVATTFTSLAFLIVEWGQANSLAAMVARDRSRAGRLLGSGLALRCCLLPLVLLLALGGCWMAGYDKRFLGVLLLVMLGSTFGTVSAACQDVMRGYERSDFAAASLIASQLLTALVVVPALLMFGRLAPFLWAQAACAALGALLLVWVLPSFGVPRLSAGRDTGMSLLKFGTSFFLFNLILALQPNVDAVFLSKLASPEAIGWQAVARKLTGLLIFPAGALASALFPTLSRLYGEDRAAFAEVAAGALRTTPAIAMPIALGCVLFPEIGIDSFGQGGFAPAAANIRVLGGFVFLLFVTMPLSTTLLAAGRQRAWLGAQCACVLLACVLDPVLIPRCQAAFGNGGLGVCLSTDAGEVMMVAAGLWLLPRDVLQRMQWRRYGAVALSGGAMAAVAVALSPLTAYAAAPLAIAAYLGALWLTGGLEQTQLDQLSSLLRRNRPAVST